MDLRPVYLSFISLAEVEASKEQPLLFLKLVSCSSPNKGEASTSLTQNSTYFSYAKISEMKMGFKVGLEISEMGFRVDGEINGRVLFFISLHTSNLQKAVFKCSAITMVLFK